MLHFAPPGSATWHAVPLALRVQRVAVAATTLNGCRRLGDTHVTRIAYDAISFHSDKGIGRRRNNIIITTP